MAKEDKGNKSFSHKRRQQERFILKSRQKDLRAAPEERPGGNDNMDLSVGKKLKS